MNYLILALVLILSACDVKVKSDAAKPENKPVTCAREVSRDIPQAFQNVGTAVSAVRTEDCGKLVVGTDPQGQIVIAKYDSSGVMAQGFGERGVLRPLIGRYQQMGVRIQRIAVIDNHYFAFGSYGRLNQTRALFVFRFLESGFLDLSFGPWRDGTARAPLDSRFSLMALGVPSVVGDSIVFRNRMEDLLSGTEVEREQVVLISGAQSMPKDLKAVPSSCELVNQSGLTEGTQVHLSQSQCHELSFRASGPMGNDAIVMATNGTTYYSNLLGEIGWHYEGRSPVLMSRDGLGFLRKEYVNFVQGQNSICGASVNPGRRYLVFSTKTALQPDWLANCWYL
jgi:hypothetical protein